MKSNWQNRILPLLAAGPIVLLSCTGNGEPAVDSAIEPVQAGGLRAPSVGAGPDAEKSATVTLVVPEYPKVIELPQGTFTIHAPQIRSWENFESMEGLAAVEIVAAGTDSPRYGALVYTADAIPDLDNRLVRVSNLDVTELTFEGGLTASAEQRDLIEEALPHGVRDIPLDLVLSHLADDAISTDTPEILSKPPEIIVSQTPARIVLLQGEPVLVATAKDSGLKFAANTNWPLFNVEADGSWYLLDTDNWLTAAALDGTWTWAAQLPEALRTLPDTESWRVTRAAAQACCTVPEVEPPEIHTRNQPAELIVIDGDPEFEQVGNLDLEYVTNTDSQLFKADDIYYFLVSGRWFSNDELTGSWQSADELPDAFSNIPRDHLKAEVLVAVAGTPEAKMAMIDAQIPKKTEMPMDTALPIEVSYNGEPSFEPIPNTQGVSRAVNTPYDIVQVGQMYYLCYSGAWYVAASPLGPWSLTQEVPKGIYQIPPSSPVYHTTYVKVYETSPVTVTYGYSSGYSSVYVVNGVPVYGSGYYYAPYYYYHPYYPVYYGYPYTYGSASYYNSVTGFYGSTSRAYGPYGGWGYSSAYNPRTGTYARAEAVWDYDEWYARGEAYNPRTGRYAETERYYNADDNEWEIDSTFEGDRGAVDVSRNFDEDSGRASIETSRGGEGTFTRTKSGDTWNTNSQFTTGDGRTVTGSGSFEDGQGSSTLTGSQGGTGTIERSIDNGEITREGSFSKDGKTLETTTVRDGSGPERSFETSEGGSGVVTGRGDQRTVVGETGSGDLYAARDGNVYKKTDDGWNVRQDGEWQSRSSSDRGQSGTDASSGTRASGIENVDRSALEGRTGNSARTSSPSFSSDSILQRDYAARQRGQPRSSNQTGQRDRSGQYQRSGQSQRSGQYNRSGGYQNRSRQTQRTRRSGQFRSGGGRGRRR